MQTVRDRNNFWKSKVTPALLQAMPSALLSSTARLREFEQQLSPSAEEYFFSRNTAARIDFHTAVGNFCVPKGNLIVLATVMIEPHYTNATHTEKQYKP